MIFCRSYLSVNLHVLRHFKEMELRFVYPVICLKQKAREHHWYAELEQGFSGRCSGVSWCTDRVRLRREPLRKADLPCDIRIPHLKLENGGRSSWRGTLFLAIRIAELANTVSAGRAISTWFLASALPRIISDTHDTAQALEELVLTRIFRLLHSRLKQAHVSPGQRCGLCRSTENCRAYQA
jgi:hypothetical protein